MGKQSRRIKLSEAESRRVRFLSSFVVNLEAGKRTSWVTLTRTGSFTDPRYGRFEISRDMLMSMVSNFEANTVGTKIFADISHKPEDGAAGEFKKLAIEGDRLRALVEWTDYGIKMLKTKGYKYFSAEYDENWRDNEVGNTHGTVLLGAGLTIRPVIKGLDPIEPDTIRLSESDHNIPTILHPELNTKLLQEIRTMWKELIEKLTANLGKYKLAEAVVKQLAETCETALKNVTDEAVAKALVQSFEDSGKKLAEEIGDKVIKLAIEVPNIPAAGTKGLTEEQVIKLMEDRSAKATQETKKLTEARDANIKILSDAVGAVKDFDDETKKELTEAVADLITADMSADQVMRLAENQIKQGNQLAAARKLASLGYQPAGNVHITVDSSNEVKALQEHADKVLKLSGQPDVDRYANTGGVLQSKNKALAEAVMAQFDATNGMRLHQEHKRLAGGSGVVSDVAVPAIFERTVIREALYSLIGLQFVDSGVAAFANSIGIPFSYRDQTAAGRNGTRTYEGQGIKRAGVIQAMESAYPIPQKLSFSISDELQYLTTNGQLNWSALAENVVNATRIIGEDTEQLLFNEPLNASDQYGALQVTNEAVATGDGNKSTFPLANFPVVRPKRIFDLQGAQVGNTQYPHTVSTNGTARLQYDGTGTQASGIYFTLNYNLGEIQFVSEVGVPVNITSGHAIVASYYRVTNVYQFNVDQGAVATDVFWDGFLYRYGLRKNIIEDDRLHRANFGLMSGSVMTTIEQARTFVATGERKGTSLDSEGNLGIVKGVPNFKTSAPGLQMGDQRVLIGERNLTRFRMLKPWSMGQLENQRDDNGNFTGKKEAYGDQFIVVHTPTPLKAGLTSIALYSAAARVAR
ncbi:phage protease [Methylobacillus caricis]|uniref:phage protease n=1 Tax=Methylobacillus caricis TaxID=1971611 RepID=UPI001CFFBD9D|nr:phage protease [Methylobacillus caricis]MCB5187374.1 phage protease [Methylobacillus caricis]